MAEKSAKRRVYIYIDGSQVENSVDAISKQLRKVQAEQKKMVIGSEEYIRAGNKITQLNAILKQHSSTINQVGQSWLNIGKITDGFNRFFGIATSIIAAITGITFAIRKSVDEFAALEEKEADVRKYTGMTKDQVKDLNEEFKKMDTRTAREQLNSLAADAGRLGIKGKKDILEFTEAGDIINVSLGEDLGKDAIKNIGKLAQMFGIEGQTLKEGMLSVGSAINEIAQNSSAAEPYLVDFAARLAGTSKQAGISISNLLGFGSVLDQNMQQVEMASTALQTLMLKLYQSPAKFAKMAGKDVEEFTKLMKTDANEALLQLLSNLKQIGGLDKLAPMFKEMGLDGVRASGVINTLASNVDKIRKEQETANQAYKDGTSVINEFTVKNNTLQASFDKAKKRFKELSYELGEKLSPYMANFISLGGSLVKVLSILTSFIIKNSTAITTLAIAGGAYITALKLMELWTKRTIIVTNLSAIANGLLKGSLYLLQVAYFSLTGQMSKARGAMVAFSLVTKVHPVAALVAVVTALAGAYILLSRKIDLATKSAKARSDIERQSKENTSEEITKIQQLKSVIENSGSSYRLRMRAIKDLQDIIPEYHASLDKEGKLINHNSNMIDLYVKKLEIMEKQKLAGARLAEAVANQDEWYKTVDNKNAARFLKVDLYKQMNPGVNDEEAAASVNVSPTAYRAFDAKRKSLEQMVEIYRELMANYSKELISINEQYYNIDDVNTEKNNGQAGGSFTEESEKEVKKRLKAKIKKYEDEASAYKASIVAMYATGKITKKEHDEFIEDADRKLLSNKMTLYSKKSSEYNDLLVKLLNMEIKAQEVCTKETIAEIEEGIEKEKRLLFDKYTDQTLSKKAYDEGILQLDRDTLVRKQALYASDSDEFRDYQRQIDEFDAKDKEKRYSEYENRLAEFRKEYQKKTLWELYKEELDKLDELLKVKAIKIEEYEKLKAAITKKYSESSENSSDPDSGNDSSQNTGTKSSRNIKSYKEQKADDMKELENDTISELDQLNEQYINGQILYESYQEGLIDIDRKYKESKDQIDEEYKEKRLKRAQILYSGLSSVASAYSEFIAASQELEVAKINERYDAQIKAAGNNSAKAKALEEKKEKEIAAIKSKYADRAFAMQIAMAIASTATAAINAYASAAEIPFIGGLTLGPIAAGMAVAAGMIQVATITKQHQAAKKGYFKGGYTPSGEWDEEQGVVHSDEFVANRFATANSTLRPIFDVIDYAQRTGTVANLTRKDLAHALSVPGYYNGGYSPRSNENSFTSTTASSNDNMLLFMGIIEQNTRVMEQMHAKLSVPLEVINTVDGEHGMKRAFDEYNKLINNKSRV